MNQPGNGGSMTARQFRMAISVLLLTIGADVVLRAQNYLEIREELSDIIQSEIARKEIPAAYVALVDGQSIVWKAAFGFADAQQKIAASTSDVFRIASVSKLFTDIAVMKLAEQGVLDIDAPLTRYLPDFRPKGIPEQSVTLRQIMSHRAGLVREPPVGHYMDPTEPSLEQTVASLNRTGIVYEPGTRIKYSNAGIAVAGYVMEKTQGKEFGRYVDEAVLLPMGLMESSFLPRPDLMKRKPRAILWTYDGRRMDVPTFQFGMAPAANMYSTLNDLATFMICLFNRGATPGGQILQGQTLEEMWRPQFAGSGQTSGIGIGFFIGLFDGERQISHSGDVYGFATEFTALPDRKLGVIVVNTLNACNDWSERIANHALRLMLAAKRGDRGPGFPVTTTVEPGLVEKVAGKYTMGAVTVEFYRRNNVLIMQGRTVQSVVRQLGNILMVDDKHNSGSIVIPLGDRVVVGKDTLMRVEDTRPTPAPERWKGLIGEYGWDHNTLYVHERNGILHAMIEWYFSYPLTEISRDTFAFPNFGLYHGEKLVFERDAKGGATRVTAANIQFERRDVGTNGQFRISPQASIDELRRKAQQASPPKEHGGFARTDLVELQTLDPTIKLDVRYATTNNFMGAVFYSEARAFLQRPAAEAVIRASKWLKQFGYGLLVHDGYRPWSVTRMFWDATPAHQRDFVADPSKGSRHNRGCAVDLALYDLKTGEPAPMVSAYDEFTVRAYPGYPGGTSLERWNRELLREAMEREGFRVYDYEWWHFDFSGWERYPIMNITFDQIQE